MFVADLKAFVRELERHCACFGLDSRRICCFEISYGDFVDGEKDALQNVSGYVLMPNSVLSDLLSYLLLFFQAITLMGKKNSSSLSVCLQTGSRMQRKQTQS